MPGRTGRKSQIHENGTKIINSHSLRGNKNGLKNAPPPAPNVDTNSTTIKSETSTNTNESLLDQSLVQELITLAENVVSGQIDAIANNEEFKPKKSPALKIGQIGVGDLKNNPKKAEQQQDDEDDIQVLAETKARQRKRVLPLKLPPEFQIKIRDHLKSKGKTVDQVDILNITSEVCKQTLEKNGVGIANCSLRVWSSHTNNSNDLNNQQQRASNSKFRETNGMSINGVKIEPSPNFGAVPLDSSSHNNSRSDFTTISSNNSSHQNNSFVKRSSTKASGKKARKNSLDKLSDQQPKSKRMKVSKRLHDHTMKEWPFQGPVSTSSNGGSN